MDNFYTFLIAITILTISPGADTVMVIRNAMRGGIQDGAATSVAICSGLFIHATVSAVGISLIILQSAWMFTALKLLGAAYLLWLGVTTIRGQAQTFEVDHAASTNSFVMWRSLREGLLSNVLNPKPIVFYMAFLPQFIDPTGSTLSQSLQMASIHFVISVVWLIAVAGMSVQMRQWLSNAQLVKRINQGLGFGLCSFGVLLATETARQ